MGEKIEVIPYGSLQVLPKDKTQGKRVEALLITRKKPISYAIRDSDLSCIIRNYSDAVRQ